MSAQVFYDWVAADELEDAHSIEVIGFPPDEAASLETFKSRRSLAPELFLGAYLPNILGPRTLIGYVCSTLSPDLSLTHASMSQHVPSSSSVCMHAVSISPDHRRKGLGVRLLREYTTRLESATSINRLKSYERILLITHEELRPFYEAAGFEWLGKSDVVHGSRPWFEMRKVLNESTPPSQVQDRALPPGIWETLQRTPRSRGPSVARQLSSFSGMSDVCAVDPDNTGNLSNKFNLLCPRQECGSIILKAAVAQWVERASVQMEPPSMPAHSLLPILPTPPETAQWWLITPSPMSFENIGFTRPIQSLSQSPETGKKIKLLACAECDLGPLGWSEEGGTEFWLACSRVGYRE